MERVDEYHEWVNVDFLLGKFWIGNVAPQTDESKSKDEYEAPVTKEDVENRTFDGAEDGDEDGFVIKE